MPMAAVWVSFLSLQHNGSAYSPSAVVVSRRTFIRDGASYKDGVLINRSEFIVNNVRSVFAASAAAQALNIPPCNAIIEFVPASPYFSGTYNDAMDIMYAQRLAVDNIINVINAGNLEEAGFKIMQLNAQTRTAGKIILVTLQENMTKDSDSILLLRYLTCQKKFGILVDLCDECGDALSIAIKKGKSDTTATTASVIKTLNVVEDTKSAYDDFLAELQIFENAIGN